MWSEIEKIRTEPMGEQELTKLKNRAEMWALATRIQLGSRADRLQSWRCFKQDTGHINRDVDMYRSITAEDIQRVANKYLDREHSVVCHVVPK
ncbi:MAG TPA: insulinase family protein, partial [Candidatus Kapabacteria bacterium]|nr:insulinase family protein [Candidatus Kapabacteria bacterium]